MRGIISASSSSSVSSKRTATSVSGMKHHPSKKARKGDRIIQLTAGTAAAVGTAAGLEVSAPVRARAKSLLCPDSAPIRPQKPR